MKQQNKALIKEAKLLTVITKKLQDQISDAATTDEQRIYIGAIYSSLNRIQKLQSDETNLLQRNQVD